MSLSGRNILIVDDDQRVRAVVSVQLEQRGAHVLEAFDGPMALAAIAGLEPIDLLITDVAMPQLDGWAFAEKARVMRPAIAVLYLTAYAGEKPRPVAGSRIVKKPFRPWELLDAATELLGSDSPTSPATATRR